MDVRKVDWKECKLVEMTERLKAVKMDLRWVRSKVVLWVEPKVAMLVVSKESVKVVALVEKRALH